MKLSGKKWEDQKIRYGVKVESTIITQDEIKDKDNIRSIWTQKNPRSNGEK